MYVPREGSVSRPPGESQTSWSWQAIRLLVMTSTSLQKEIVESGRVSWIAYGLAAFKSYNFPSP